MPAYAGMRPPLRAARPWKDERRTRRRCRDRQEQDMDAVFTVPGPHNEPVRAYAPNSGERTSLQRRIAELAGERAELTMTIGGVPRMGGGPAIDVVEPHRHSHVLGVTRNATNDDAAAAVEA